MANARTELMARVDELSDAAWALAALAASVGDAPLSDEHGALLAACGLAEHEGEGGGLGEDGGDGGGRRLRADYTAVLAAQRDPAAFPRRIAEMLRRAADAAEGRAVSDETDDAAFLADGRSSGAHMRVILAALVERIPGFADLLDHGVPRFLDVGTGIGAISAELVERSPGARAQGVDVDPRALRLAEEYLDERGVRDRVETRLLDVAELSETSGYDVVWLPLSVLAPETTEAALPRIRAALRPGGWLVAATALGDEPGEGGADVHSAVVRWRMALSGVTPWGPGTVRRRLEEFGFGDVRSVGAPSGTVTVLTARAPEAPVSGD
jgi:predicted O-methyltransferase YrrM